MWTRWIESSMAYPAFLNGCEPRMNGAIREMTQLLLRQREVLQQVPHLKGQQIVLLCFCEPRCLDCHPLLPLLDLANERNPWTRLGILPHRPNEQFLQSLLPDPTLPTLPTVVLLEGTPPHPRDFLFGRPEAMDVVTWRTGEGWRALYLWLTRNSGGDPPTDW